MTARLLFPILLSATWLTSAHAQDFELAITSEALAPVSDTTGATTTSSVTTTPGIRIGWRPVAPITALIGWRHVTTLTRADHGYALSTEGDAILVGARYSFELHPVFDVHLELELEALHATFDLDLANSRGTTSAWSLGAIPKVAASARVDLSAFFIELRAFVGFAFRTNHRADGLRLASEAPSANVTPLDLGSLNLSGVVMGAELAFLF